MRTFGKVWLNKPPRQSTWEIDCEPQVALRLKRVFGKASAWAQDTILLADTIENGRDLAWFLERYPLEISAKDKEHLLEKDKQYRKLITDIGHILSGDYAPQPVSLALPLRDYQRIAVDLAKRTRGTLSADEVGLGKTAEAIGLIADPSARPALIVTLTHLPAQWKSEIDKFLPGLHIHILKKGTVYDFSKGGFPDVIISNYHKLSGWAGELSGKVKSVIFDECQELRRDESAKYKAAKAVADHANFRFGLSATPVYNYGGEIFNVMNVLSPGSLGDWNEFQREWCGESWGNKPIVKDSKALGSYLRESGLMLRRTRVEVKRELPGLTTVPHVIDADMGELEKIKGSASELAKVILAQGGMGFDKMKAAEEFSWRLRQATGIAKSPFVADFVRLLVEDGESVLLYGWHHEVYSLWAERLKDLKPVFFTGKESPNQKETSKQAFVSGETKLLIMSLRAGQGIDGLQKVCRTVVHGELDWSPAVHEQGTGRVYRDGQTDPVVSYFLMADSGSDPVITDVLGVKRGQITGIIDPNAELVTKSQTDPDRMKKLAEDYLERHGG